MASSMMSMASAPPAPPSLSTRLSTLSSTCFSFSLSSTSRSKPRFQFLSIKLQTTILTSPSFTSRVPLLAASFDGFEPESDTLGSEGEDLEPEPEPEEFGGQEKRKVSGSREYGRLYVGNLPYSMTSSQLAELFQESGRVINVEMVYDRVTDRSRGFGFVTMGSVDEATDAIRMFDGSQVGGRTVKVNFPEVPRGGERELMGSKIRSSERAFVDSPHKVYAGNLGWGLTSQGLREAFADQSGLLSAKVIYDRNSGRSRGFGFISFDSAEAADAAVSAMNGVEVEGRPLRLNIAAERASPSPAVEMNTESKSDGAELISSISS